MNSTTIAPQAISFARPTADPPILPPVKLATIPDVVDVGDTAGEAAVCGPDSRSRRTSPYWEQWETNKGKLTAKATKCHRPTH